MADRPKVSGWKNINLNKPEEYSSEFTRDGLTYANVTNVTTGQRQLYFVSGLSGSPITQRSLLSTTNADGKITVGAARDDFIRTFGKDKLDTAEKLNKQQSVKLLSIPGLSTKTELKNIKDSKEFKSSNIGSNAATTGSDGIQQVSLDIKESGKQRDTTNSFGNHRYPEKLTRDKQDTIKFSMLKYKPRQVSTSGIYKGGNLGGFQDRSTDRIILGTVVLPIPSGISEVNGVEWGSQTMGPGEIFAANIALTGIKEGLGKAAEVAGGAAAGAAGSGNQDLKTAVATGFAEAATGVGNLLSRTQGAIFNPNMELLFSGPTLRPFNFTFKLSARSDTEAKQIIKIIRFFKQGMSPQKSQSNLYLKAPHTFKIQYMYQKKDHPYIGAIKECALQSFTVDYTPEGQYATFADGVMVSYQITMQFQELEPVFNEDYGNDGNDMPVDLLFRESATSKQ